MSAFVRYPLLGCLALSLIACGSSGSQTLLRAPELSTTATTSRYASVEYLLVDSAAVTAAREQFVSDPHEDTDATAPSENASLLNLRRSRIVNNANRYLSTGVLVAETDSSQDPATVSHQRVATTSSCTDSDGVTASSAKCVFGMDTFRDEITFHLGSTIADDEGNNVGFRSFISDRQPVMDYRGVRMSQVRVTGTDAKENTDPNEDPVESDYEYVGYDGMLQYSMFFVGVYKFFDDGMGDDRELEHLRFDHASLGHIYDQEDQAGVQNPDISLTGDGVMVGMESENDTLNHHLVQGDVNIDYDPANTDTELDITITNIQRLVGSDTAWYADSTRIANLDWDGVPVSDSKFSASSPAELLGSFYGTPNTSEDPDVDNGVYEVGGVFYHAGSQYSIFGAFGAPLKSEAQQE